MRIGLRGLICALSLASLGTAFAHDTYLLPEAKWRGGKTMVLLLTSAETFPKLEFGPKAARVVATTAHGPDAAAAFAVAREGAKGLKLRLTAKAKGAYAVGLGLGPRDIDLDPKTVGHYFEEVDASKDVRDAYAALPEPRQWRETYEKFAKAFVCAAACGDKAAFAEPTNLKAEFIAVKESLATKRVAFRLLKDGAPVTDQAVAVVSAKGRRTMLRTNANGELNLPERLKGPVLLSAVMLQPPANETARFTSIFVSLTFNTALLGTQ